MAARHYSVSVPAASGSLAPLRAFFKAALLEELEDVERDDPSTLECVERLILALDEAAANVIKHRTPRIDDGRIRISMAYEDVRLTFRLGGFCTQDDVESIKPRSLAEIRPGGLGTAFIGKIMHRVAYEPDPDDPAALALVLEFDCSEEETGDGV